MRGKECPCVSTLVTMDRAKDGLAEEKGGGRSGISGHEECFHNFCRAAQSEKGFHVCCYFPGLAGKSFRSHFCPRGAMFCHLVQKAAQSQSTGDRHATLTQSQLTPKTEKKLIFNEKNDNYTSSRFKEQGIHRGSGPSQFLTYLQRHSSFGS